jgi:hypothetical protein
MAEDVPKTIILSLLILTVLISVLGTWTVMDKLNSMKVNYVSQQHPAQGKVMFKFAEPSHKEASPATGKVVFKFEEPKEVS